jgi:Cu-Zn family superoxide dismutase
VRRILAVAALAGLAGCQSIPADAPHAYANLQPTKNGKASGTVDFYQVGDKVRLIAKVSGLTPGRQHGFHIHEAGDCSSGDGMSAKGHFNPLAKAHAHFSTAERHAGDMPALSADADGNASLDVMLDVVTVNPGPTSIVGRGLIVHADPDDYKTQPTGNAGARVACAVIGRRS